MELTGNDVFLSFEDLLSIVGEYVDHLRSHNQTEKLKELFDSMHRHKDIYGRGLEPMLNFISKHGMPHQFPADGSHFNEDPDSIECGPRFNSSSDVALIRTSEYW
jgi:hypothetical protein